MSAPISTDRSRLYRWGDTKAGAAAAQGMSGKDYLTGIMKGEIVAAPMAETLNFRLAEVEDGRVVFVCEPSEFHYNPIGSVHGGLAATLIDSATGCAVHTTLPAGVGYATVNFSVDLIKGITDAVGTLRCEGRIVRAGGRIAVADAELKGPDGTLYARGTATCLVMRPEKR
ncbi:MAG: PaaI family thioesterase [Rhodospirillaceae bacterium]|nr:PaaI family thioesterase [Rhodospirillaceae bacterium]